ncbi:hypothetical protein DIS24_g12099, partial [Lasiodiplodia hormozganensis]
VLPTMESFGELYLRLDESAARNYDYYRVSSIVQIGSPSSSQLTQYALVCLAEHALADMISHWKHTLQNFGTRTEKDVRPYLRPPTVITILHHHDRLYLSSSVKKNPPKSWLRIHTTAARNEGRMPAAEAIEIAHLHGHDHLPHAHATNLDESDHSYSDTAHPCKANCGEILAIHQWAVKNPGKPLSALKNSCIVSLTKAAGKPCIKPPCIGGCANVLEALQIQHITHHLIDPPTWPLPDPTAFEYVSITDSNACLDCAATGQHPENAASLCVCRQIQPPTTSTAETEEP